MVDHTDCDGKVATLNRYIDTSCDWSTQYASAGRCQPLTPNCTAQTTAATHWSDRVCAGGTSSGGGDDKPSAGADVGITLAVLVAVALLVYLAVTYGGRVATTKTQKQIEGQELLLAAAGRTEAELRDELKRKAELWQIPEDHVKFVTLLASGGFGDVWKGRYGGQAVAIKLLKRPLDDELDPEAAEEYERENATLQSIRHPHLLIFLGSGTTATNKPFLVTEFMDLGSLRGVLADTGRVLDWAVRARVAAEIAAGMAHLHSLKIVHRDLKSDNCLCDAELNTKVGDFGASKLMQAAKARGPAVAAAGTATTVFGASATATMTKDKGTPLWMAPEVFGGGRHYGPEVDVYSYGVILWELLTRREPWDEIEAGQYIDFQRQLGEALAAGRRPAVDPADAEAHPQFTYVALMAKSYIKCWAGDPHARPTFEFEMVSFSLTL